LSSFITKKVKNMNYMFYFCSSLTSINISNFYINNSVSIIHMFSHCSNLVFIDISSFYIDKTDIIFFNPPSKGKIIVSKDYYNSIKELLSGWEIVIP